VAEISETWYGVWIGLRRLGFQTWQMPHGWPAEDHVTAHPFPASDTLTEKSHVGSFISESTNLTCIPACRRTLRAGKSNNYFHLKYSKNDIYRNAFYTLLKPIFYSYSKTSSPSCTRKTCLIVANIADLEKGLFSTKKNDCSHRFHD